MEVKLDPQFISLTYQLKYVMSIIEQSTHKSKYVTIVKQSMSSGNNLRFANPCRKYFG
jgi:hypothetical protein